LRLPTGRYVLSPQTLTPPRDGDARGVMIDWLAGRCSEHGWLSKEERAAECCFRCEYPEVFEEADCLEDFDDGEPDDDDPAQGRARP
jgi:hypothetical protein